MRIYKDLKQHLEDGTANPEWLYVRAGKFTGSDFNQYMSLLKKNELSDTAESNLYKKVLESFGYTIGHLSDVGISGDMAAIQADMEFSECGLHELLSRLDEERVKLVKAIYNKGNKDE